MKNIIATALLASSMSSYAGTLHFQWEEVVNDVEGAPLQSPVSYEIKYGRSGEPESEVVVSAVGTTTSVEVDDVAATYYATIRSSVSNTVGTTYSAWSPVITSTLQEQLPSVPSVPVFTMRFECDGCNLQVVGD